MIFGKRGMKGIYAVLLAFIICLCTVFFCGTGFILAAEPGGESEEISEDAASPDHIEEMGETIEGVSADGVSVSVEDSSDTAVLRDGSDGVSLDDFNFSNVAFRNFVSYYFDKDKDEILSDTELGNAESMNIPDTYGGAAITKAKGIEYFTNLKTLTVRSSSLKEINLKNNTALTSLELNGCSSLTGADLSANTGLTNLKVYNCGRITSLDLSGNTGLININIEGNEKLTGLKFGNLSSLTEFSFNNNDAATGLVLSDADSLTKISCMRNLKLKSFETGSMGSLQTVYFYENEAAEGLDLTGADNIQYFDCYSNPVLETIKLGDKSNLNTFYCYKNGIKELDLTGASKIVKFSCHDNSQLSAIKGLNDLTLTNLVLNNNGLKELDFSGNKNIQEINLTGNVLETVTFSGNTELMNVYLNNNNLTSINLSEVGNLQVLQCENNKLESMDLSSAESLVTLNCGNNSLTELKGLDKLTYLRYLYCSNNSLKSMDLSGLTDLRELKCSNNVLTELKADGCDSLSTIDIVSNRLLSVECGEDSLFSKNSYKMSDRNVKIQKVGEGYLAKLKEAGWASADHYELSGYPEGITFEITGDGILFGSDPFGGGKSIKVNLHYFVSSSARENGKVNLDIPIVIWNTDISDEIISRKVKLDADNFPDEEFRKALSEGCGYQGSSSVRVNEGEYFEPGKMTQLKLSKKDIRNLKGLEYFVQLDSLYVNEDALTELDLSVCPTLTRVECAGNPMKSLGLKGLSFLSYLDCRNNMLSSLDLSDLSALESFYCDNNRLGELNLSGNNRLRYISCSSQKVDILVYEKDGYWEALDPILTTLKPTDSAIDYKNSDKGLTGAETVSGGWHWNKDPFGAYYFRVLKVNREFTYGDEGRITLDLEITFNNAGAEFEELVELNEENFPDEVLRNYLQSNYSDSIEEGKLRVLKVEEITINDKKLENLKGIEKLVALKTLEIRKAADLKDLDLSKNTMLTSLSLYDLGITWLDLTNQKSLTKLNVYGTPVLGIDINKDCDTGKLIAYIVPSACPMRAEKDGDGKYVLKMPDRFKSEKVFDFSETLTDGKAIWGSAEDIPFTLTYSYMFKSAYEPGESYKANTDYFTASISLTNNDLETEMPESHWVPLDEEHFPNESFRTFLSKEYADGGDQINTGDVEELRIYNYSYSGYNDLSSITSLKGIEYLDRLRKLDLHDIPLLELDLSKNRFLTSINIEGEYSWYYYSGGRNALSDLNISGCEYLESCSVKQASISKLDISKCKRLRTLELPGSSIKKIKLDNNAKLRRLDLRDNILQELDVKKNSHLQYLDISNSAYREDGLNAVKELDLSGLKELETLLLNGNNFSSIDITGLERLSEFSIDGGSDGKLKEVNLGNLSSLTTLTITRRSAYTSTYDWEYDEDSGKSGEEDTLSVIGDFRTLKRLRTLRLENVSVSGNSVGGLDLSECKYLSNLYLSGSKVIDLNLKDNTNLRRLYLYGIGRLDNLDVSGCTQLDTLDVSKIGLKSLKIDNMYSLKELNCNYNKLEELVTAGAPGLQILRCEHNRLKTLDLNNNQALKILECEHNPLRSFDLADSGSSDEEDDEPDDSGDEGETGDDHDGGTSSVIEELKLDECALTSLDVSDMLMLDLDDLTCSSQVLELTWDDDEILEFELPASAMARLSDAVKGDDTSCRRVFKLKDIGNSFDMSKVTAQNLGGGTLTEKGIVYEAGQAIPDTISYAYKVDNKNGKDISMNVQIKVYEELPVHDEDDPYDEGDDDPSKDPKKNDSPRDPSGKDDSDTGNKDPDTGNMSYPDWQNANAGYIYDYVLEKNLISENGIFYGTTPEYRKNCQAAMEGQTVSENLTVGGHTVSVNYTEYVIYDSRAKVQKAGFTMKDVNPSKSKHPSISVNVVIDGIPVPPSMLKVTFKNNKKAAMATDNKAPYMRLQIKPDDGSNGLDKEFAKEFKNALKGKDTLRFNILPASMNYGIVDRDFYYMKAGSRVTKVLNLKYRFNLDDVGKSKKSSLKIKRDYTAEVIPGRGNLILTGKNNYTGVFRAYGTEKIKLPPIE